MFRAARGPGAAGPRRPDTVGRRRCWALSGGALLALGATAIAAALGAPVRGQQGGTPYEIATAGGCPDHQGVAFDGRDLLTACDDSGHQGELLASDPRTGAFRGYHHINGVYRPSALDWDPIRQQLWVCGRASEADTAGGNVYLVDLDAPSPTPYRGPPGSAQPQITGVGCGVLAYDVTDDTLWTGGTVLEHRTRTGQVIASFDLSTGIIGHGRRLGGVAVVGSSLYLDSVGGEIWVSDKNLDNATRVVNWHGQAASADSDGSSLHDFDFFDLACDDVTFRSIGTTVMWVTDDDNPDLLAFRIGTNLPCNPPIPPQPLTVTKAGTGTGTVVSRETPPKISCPALCQGTSASYPTRTPVTLLASATAGSSFAGWGGACSGRGACFVVVNSPTAVTATFTLTPQGGQPPPALTVSSPVLDEPAAGRSAPATFTLAISAARPYPVTADYQTFDGTATAPVDYTPVAGTLTFAPGGPLSLPVSVVVSGDSDAPQPPTFFYLAVTLTNAVATIPQGVAVIRDDGAVVASSELVPRSAGGAGAQGSNGQPSSQNQAQQAQDQAQSQAQAQAGQAQAQAQTQAQAQAQGQTAAQAQPALMLERERELQLERALNDPGEQGRGEWLSLARTPARTLAGVVLLCVLLGAEWGRSRHRLRSLEAEGQPVRDARPATGSRPPARWWWTPVE